MVGNLKNQDNPRFTLNELKDVLTERNTLKSKLIEIEDELAYYKSKYVCFTLIYITRCYCANDWLYHPYTIPPIHYHPYTIPPIHYTTYPLPPIRYTTCTLLLYLYVERRRAMRQAGVQRSKPQTPLVPCATHMSATFRDQSTESHGRNYMANRSLASGNCK